MLPRRVAEKRSRKIIQRLKGRQKLENSSKEELYDDTIKAKERKNECNLR